MPETNVGSTKISDFAGTQGDFSVDDVSTEGPVDQPETIKQFLN
jgi:hypothetical protein